MGILINLGKAVIATAAMTAIGFGLAYVIVWLTFREPTKEEEDGL